MYKSYLMLADKRLQRHSGVLSHKKEDAINNLYQEGVAMAMVFSEEVYLCVTDLDAGGKKSSIYQITENGNIHEVNLVSWFLLYPQPVRINNRFDF